ncbi:MAG: hypothetical protein FWD01_01880, partial [Defluviitaleaceae bacterium]|nr:hypothetical protein [Defluviitaleaceae bacterium]
PLEISVLVNEENEERVAIARNLAANLRSAGAAAVTEIVSFDEYQHRLLTGDFDIFVGGFSLALNPDLSFAFHSDNIGGSNIFGYNSNEMDLLLYIVRQSTTDFGLMSGMRDLQNHIADNLPIYGIAFNREIVTTSPRLYGNFATRADDIFANIRQWFVAH